MRWFNIVRINKTLISVSSAQKVKRKLSLWGKINNQPANSNITNKIMKVAKKLYRGQLFKVPKKE